MLLWITLRFTSARGLIATKLIEVLTSPQLHAIRAPSTNDSSFAHCTEG
jgi:hypothetical protein